MLSANSYAIIDYVARNFLAGGRDKYGISGMGRETKEARDKYYLQ